MTYFPCSGEFIDTGGARTIFPQVPGPIGTDMTIVPDDFGLLGVQSFYFCRHKILQFILPIKDADYPVRPSAASKSRPKMWLFPGAPALFQYPQMERAFSPFSFAVSFLGLRPRLVSQRAFRAKFAEYGERIAPNARSISPMEMIPIEG